MRLVYNNNMNNGTALYRPVLLYPVVRFFVSASVCLQAHKDKKIQRTVPCVPAWDGYTRTGPIYTCRLCFTAPNILVRHLHLSLPIIPIPIPIPIQTYTNLSECVNCINCFFLKCMVKSDKAVMTVKKTLCAILSFVMLFTLFPITYAVADNLPFSDDPKAIQVASNSVIMLSCYDINGNLYATGSAFAAFEEGVFITNCHVIEKEVYSIRAQMETGLEFSINSVVAYDADKDIAILRTETETGLAPLPIGSTANLERGEKVIAIGSPLGLINTISIGIYSGTIQDNQIYLQFSAPISQGSSGGALFNNRGEVVGITAASFTEGQNLNLAIPIGDAVELWENRAELNELSIPEFYNEWEHIISTTISFIVSHPNELDNQMIKTDGYYYPDETSDLCFYLLSSKSEIQRLEKAIEDYDKEAFAAISAESTETERENAKTRRERSKREYNELLENNAVRVFIKNTQLKQGDLITVQGIIKGNRIGTVKQNAVIVE